MKNLSFVNTFAIKIFCLLAFVFMTGCTSMYIDGALDEVDASKFKKPDPLKPVQAIFEFQTEGVANQRATDYLKEQVLSQISDSGLFSEVSEEPVEGGNLIAITLNNVPITDSEDAFAKGFAAGFTFGLVGAQVSDGYICTARYSSSLGNSAIEKQSRHAIHATVGNSSAPPNAIKASNADEAVRTMARQIVSNVLFSLSNDPDFK